MALCQTPLAHFSLPKLKDGRDVQRRWESCSQDSIGKCTPPRTEQSLIAHSVALQISHLQESNVHVERSSRFPEPPIIPQIPQILRYPNLVHAGEEIDPVLSPRIPDVDALNATALALVGSVATPSTVIEDPNETLLTTQGLGSEEVPAIFDSNTDAQATMSTAMQAESDPASFTASTLPKHTGLSGVDESLNTQSSNVPNMQRTIRGMMQFEHMTQGDTQPQMFLHPPQSEGTASTTSSARGVPSAPAPKATLSQTMIQNLDKSKGMLRKPASRLANSEGSKKQKTSLILCQCGFAEEEGDMVS